MRRMTYVRLWFVWMCVYVCVCVCECLIGGEPALRRNLSTAQTEDCHV